MLNGNKLNTYEGKLKNKTQLEFDTEIQMLRWNLQIEFLTKWKYKDMYKRVQQN